jgi:hypothetical protein
MAKLTLNLSSTFIPKIWAGELLKGLEQMAKVIGHLPPPKKHEVGKLLLIENRKGMK